MVTNIYRKTIKRDFPEVKVLFELTKEIRTDKFGSSLLVYRVQWYDEDNKACYYVFNSLSSALDFLNSNFIVSPNE